MSHALEPPLRLGVLGCGRVFQRFHLPAISRVPGLRLHAACDLDSRPQHWTEGRSPQPILYSSLEELLRRAEVEALLVLTPPSTHADATVRALDAGVHVLVEKPMALDPGEGARMIQAAQQARRRLQVGFSRRFRDPYQQLRAGLAALDRREIREVRFELAFPTGRWQAQTDFLGKESLGGGVLDDVLSHQVDLICWMFGRPDEVRAETSPPPDGAVRAELRLGSLTVRCRAAHARYAERLEVESTGGRTLEASGSALRSGGSRLPSWRRRRALIGDRLSLLNDRLLGRVNTTLASFEAQLRDFTRGTRGGSSEGASGEDGLLAVEVVHACRVSASTGGAWRRLDLSAQPAA